MESDKDSSGKPTILIGEDDEGLLNTLRKLLEPEFEIVATVGDGQALIEAATALTPDLIITDVSMSILNGFQAARRLKAIQPNARILFLTMHVEPAFVAEARKLGACGYVNKSSAYSDLLRAAFGALRNDPFFASAPEE